MNIEVDGVKKKAGITRVHLEEDVAKMIHHNAELGEGYSLVDVNRAGTPLMEIVGEPDLRSPEEARQYLIKLRSILQYLGVSTGNMEEGSFRCDANISIRPVNTSGIRTKVEVKNMNSFRAVFRAWNMKPNGRENWPKKASGWSRRPGDGWKKKVKLFPSAARNMLMITVIFRSRTCLRYVSNRPG